MLGEDEHFPVFFFDKLYMLINKIIVFLEIFNQNTSIAVHKLLHIFAVKSCNGYFEYCIFILLT